MKHISIQLHITTVVIQVAMPADTVLLHCTQYLLAWAMASESDDDSSTVWPLDLEQGRHVLDVCVLAIGLIAQLVESQRGLAQWAGVQHACEAGAPALVLETTPRVPAAESRHARDQMSAQTQSAALDFVLARVFWLVLAAADVPQPTTLSTASSV